MNRHLKYNVILWILVLLYGCAAQKPAPVDRSYEEKPVEAKKEVSK
jgi:PBP1b-binding outer membrane lipoprotein LpoB